MIKFEAFVFPVFYFGIFSFFSLFLFFKVKCVPYCIFAFVLHCHHSEKFNAIVGNRFVHAPQDETFLYASSIIQD
jgi:hypothetical protein